MHMGNEAWINGESFGSDCVAMSGGSDAYKLKSVGCTSSAKYACMKPGKFWKVTYTFEYHFKYVIDFVHPACPTGTSLFAGNRCIKLETTAADKAGAETQCKSISHKGTLLSIKNHYEQKELEEFLKDNSVTEDIYIGAAKDGNQWFWGDKSPVFVARKF